MLRSWVYIFGCNINQWRVYTLHNGNSVKEWGKGDLWVACYIKSGTGSATPWFGLRTNFGQPSCQKWQEHFWEFFHVSPFFLWCFSSVLIQDIFTFFPFQPYSCITVSQANISSLFCHIFFLLPHLKNPCPSLPLSCCPSEKFIKLLPIFFFSLLLVLLIPRALLSKYRFSDSYQVLVKGGKAIWEASFSQMYFKIVVGYGCLCWPDQHKKPRWMITQSV